MNTHVSRTGAVVVVSLLAVSLLIGTAIPGSVVASAGNEGTAGSVEGDAASPSLSVSYTVDGPITAVEEPVAVRVTVDNGGDAEGTRSVTVTADGEAVETRTVTVPAGETRTETVTVTFDTPGEHTVAAGDRPTTAVTVGEDLLDVGALSSTFDVTEDLGAWNRFIFPLRADGAAAETTIPNRDRRIFLGGDAIGLGKDPAGVYAAGESVPVTYRPSRAVSTGDAFAGVPVQLMAVRIEEKRELSIGTIREVATGEAESTSEIVATRTLDDTGVGEFSFTPERSGQYVLFFAAPTAPGSAFETRESGFAVAGNMTLLGFDTLSVQEAASTATVTADGESVDRAVAGRNLTLSVDAGDLSGETDHVVALYDDSAYAGAKERIIVEGGLSVGGIAEQTDVQTVDYVDGQRRIEDGFVVAGVNFTDDQLSRVPGFGSTIDFFGESAGRSPPNASNRSAPPVLAGSFTARTDGPTATITVGTEASFPSGTYRYVHLAGEADGTALASDTGTVRIVNGTRLALSVDETAPLVGEPVTLEVTEAETGTPVATTVTVGDRRLATGSDGTAVVRFEAAGSRTLTAEPPGRLFVGAERGLTVREPASLRVESVSLAKSAVDPGETDSVTATVRNVGDVAGSESLTFRVAGTAIEQSRTVNVAPGATEAVRFEFTLPEPGLYGVTVGDGSRRSVAVRSSLPRTDDFGAGLGAWSRTAGGGSVGYSAGDGGRAELTVVGTGSVTLGRETGPLEVGTNVTVTYDADALAGTGARIELVANDSVGTTTLAVDEAGAADGRLSARLPRDLRRDGRIGVRVAAAGADGTVGVDAVRFGPPPGVSRIDDDFEDDRLGEPPADWTVPEDEPAWTGRPGRVVDRAATGDRALRLEGYLTPADPDDDVGVTVVERPLSIPESGATTVRARMRVAERPVDQFVGPAPGIYFADRVQSRSDGRLVGIDTVGAGGFGDGFDSDRGVVPVERGEWTDVTVVHRRHDGRVRLSYRVDGERVGSRLRTEDVADDGGGLALVSGTGAVLFDDVTVRTEANRNPAASIEVTPERPVADPSATVTFDASGTVDPDGDVESYEWTFGDGTTATGETVERTFDEPGRYTATVTAVDDDGAIDRVRRDVTVLAPGTAVSVTGYDLGATTTAVGETLAVNATLKNLGVDDATPTVAVRANGSVLASREVSVGSGLERTVSVPVAFDAPGRYTVTVGDRPATTVRVEKRTVALSVRAETPESVVFDSGTVTATRPVTFVASRGATATGTPADGTLRIVGTAPLDGDGEYRTILAVEDGTAVWSNPTSGRFTATFGRAGTATTDFRNDSLELTVERASVGLDLTANRTAVPDDGAVRFSIRRADTGAPTNATLSVDGRRVVTGADGAATVRLPTPGTVEARATKPRTDAATFEPATRSVAVEPRVAVEEFDLSAAGEGRVAASFVANRSLSDRRIVVRNRTGVVATLADLNATSVADGVRYEGSAAVDPRGVYTATLAAAETADGANGPLGLADAAVLLGGNRTELRAPATAGAPTVDGDLDDPAWLGARDYPLVLAAETGTTTVNLSLLHDGEYLYVGVETDLPSGTYSRLNVSVDGDRDGRLTGAGSPPTDVAVSYSGPGGLGSYRDYARLGADDPLAAPPGLERASAGDTRYEYRLPLESLGAGPGDTVGLRLLAHPGGFGDDRDYHWPVGPTPPSLTAEDWAGLRIETADVTARFDARTGDGTAPVVGENATLDAGESSATVGSVAAYEWDLDGDGTFDDARGATVTGRFVEPGVRRVALRVRTDDGGTDRLVREVDVSAARPVGTPFEDTFAGDLAGWRIDPRSDDGAGGRWTAAGDGTVRLNATDGPVTLSRPVGAVDRGERVTVAYDAGAATGDDAGNAGDGTADGNATLSVALETPDGDRIEVASTTTGADRAAELSGLVRTGIPSGSRLVVTAENGPVGVRSVAVETGAAPPEPAVAVEDRTPTVGESVTLDASGTTDLDGDDTALRYTWDLDGDGETDATGPTATATVEATGRAPVRLTVTDADGLTAGLGRNLTVLPAGTDELGLADDFEDDPVGSYPDGWRANGNDDQAVTDRDAASGDRSFELSGDPRGCWEPIANRGVDVPADGTLVFAADVWVPSGTEIDADAGCHGNNAQAKLRTSAAGWSAGERTDLFGFDNGGELRVGGERTGSYVPGTWNDLRVRYERTGGVVRITHRLNGERVGTVVRPAPGFDEPLRYLSLSGGDTTVRFDDVVVGTNDTSPAGTAAVEPAFSANVTDPVAGAPVAFDASATTGGASLYLWDFDGDGETDATGEQATHTFTASGTRTVTLIAVGDGLRSVAAERTYTIELAPDVAPYDDTTAVSVAGLPHGTVRVESGAADATGVGNGSVDASALSLDVATETDGTVTVYVDRSALPDGDETPALFVGGELRTYYRTAGGGAEWAALTLRGPVDTTARFAVDTAPTLSATLVTGVHYPRTPVGLRIDADSPDDRLSSVEYRLPGGRTASLTGLDRRSFAGLTNVTVGANTWNAAAGHYEEREITIVVTDAGGDTATARVPVTVRAAGDATADGVVDVFDAIAVARAWRTERGDPGYRAAADLNRDGRVDLLDATLIGRSWAETAAGTGA